MPDALKLLPVTEDDLDMFIDIYTSEEIMRTIGGRMTKEQATAIHSRSISKVEKLGYKIIKGNQRAGIISAWNAKVEDQEIMEVGWIILAEYHRQGIASRAIPMLINKIKATLPNQEFIHAFCSANGIAANALVEKQGFKFIKPLSRTYGSVTLDCNWWTLSIKNL